MKNEQCYTAAHQKEEEAQGGRIQLGAELCDGQGHRHGLPFGEY